MFLSEWREFPSALCLAEKKMMTARVSMLLKSRPSLTCFRTCFLPGRSKNLSATLYIHLYIYIHIYDTELQNFFRFGVYIYIYTHTYIHTYIHIHTKSKNIFKLCMGCLYTGCPRRNVPDFGRMFLMLMYTDITQNTYIQS